MARITQKITPCLWFDDQAEEAASFYVSLFRNSKVGAVTHYGESGPGPKGGVLTVAFELDGQAFLGLNGGPAFTFDEAVSFIVNCEDQAEVDYFWERFTAGGGKESQCGWLKDRFGLSWQIVPAVMFELMSKADAATSERIMVAVMTMVKLDAAKIEAAARGQRP